MKNLFWKFVFQKDQCMNHRHDTNLDDDFGAGKLIRRQTSKRAPEVATKLRTLRMRSFRAALTFIRNNES